MSLAEAEAIQDQARPTPGEDRTGASAWRRFAPMTDRAIDVKTVGSIGKPIGGRIAGQTGVPSPDNEVIEAADRGLHPMPGGWRRSLLGAPRQPAG